MNFVKLDIPVEICIRVWDIRHRTLIMIFKTLKAFGEMFESAQNLYNLANMFDALYLIISKLPLLILPVLLQKRSQEGRSSRKIP